MLWECGSRWAKFCEISSHSVKYGMYAINSMSHFRFFCFKFLSPQCHKQTPLGYRKLNDMSMKSYVHLSAAKICESWTAWNCTSIWLLWQSGKHENSMTITLQLKDNCDSAQKQSLCFLFISASGGTCCYLGDGEPVPGAIEADFFSWGSRFFTGI